MTFYPNTLSIEHYPLQNRNLKMYTHGTSLEHLIGLQFLTRDLPDRKFNSFSNYHIFLIFALNINIYVLNSAPIFEILKC